ncbi:hypothetical protein E5288_WYG017631 [Bos mutus]|uniref:Uncharacterized protein n=1 Tax=Bos mutus TaxID=72004 RepID=A0A6B0RS66_9CETA|nr:hypothetical protein [Bos mutus]
MALLAEAERKVKNSQSFFSGLFGFQTGDGRAAPTSALEAERWRFPKHSVSVEEERGQGKSKMRFFFLPAPNGPRRPCSAPSGFQTVLLFLGAFPSLTSSSDSLSHIQNKNFLPLRYQSV